jgi:hypothetical protein
MDQFPLIITKEIKRLPSKEEQNASAIRTIDVLFD